MARSCRAGNAALLLTLVTACAFDAGGPAASPSAPRRDAQILHYADGAQDLRAQDAPAGLRDGAAAERVADQRRVDGVLDTDAHGSTVDAPRRDATVDTVSPDIKVDTRSRPDGWISDAAAASCAARYGAATSYTLCAVDETSCTFGFARANDEVRVSCNFLCGGQCLTAHDNAGGSFCIPEVEPGCTSNSQPVDCTCTTTFQSGICTCSR